MGGRDIGVRHPKQKKKMEDVLLTHRGLGARRGYRPIVIDAAKPAPLLYDLHRPDGLRELLEPVLRTIHCNVDVYIAHGPHGLGSGDNRDGRAVRARAPSWIGRDSRAVRARAETVTGRVRATCSNGRRTELARIQR